MKDSWDGFCQYNKYEDMALGPTISDTYQLAPQADMYVSCMCMSVADLRRCNNGVLLVYFPDTERSLSHTHARVAPLPQSTFSARAQSNPSGDPASACGEMVGQTRHEYGSR